jgi:hypothetical protein
MTLPARGCQPGQTLSACMMQDGEGMREREEEGKVCCSFKAALPASSPQAQPLGKAC